VARREEEIGAISEGFRTTMFPAATAPINGSKDTPVIEPTITMYKMW
jgi:hypothetical protein